MSNDGDHDSTFGRELERLRSLRTGRACPGRMARTGLEEWLSRSREDFAAAAGTFSEERRTLSPARVTRFLTLDEVLELHADRHRPERRVARRSRPGPARIRPGPTGNDLRRAGLVPDSCRQGGGPRLLARHEPPVRGRQQAPRPRGDGNVPGPERAQIAADVDEQERVVLGVAAGTISREDFTSWVRSHLVELDKGP